MGNSVSDWFFIDCFDTYQYKKESRLLETYLLGPMQMPLSFVTDVVTVSNE